jgi:hypothetical protein
LACKIGAGNTLKSSASPICWAASWLGGSGVVHETKKPTIRPPSKTLLKTLLKIVLKNCWNKFMTLLILEALLALFILIGIVWWTMFSGRTKGEIRKDQSKNSEPE